ncbi:MAG: sigma-54 dependent transcriptional regulator [Gammaproteobacteria bacterium]|nr:sigma-54 dependent transcriptional regulator [Gammaproteobacteria bacterium]MCW9029929.1 sigma-54 dependent transcriptional regulator [Gammaproteobacteria bacterium]
MKGSTILVVEDDHALAEALQDTLVTAGYNVALAENGRLALAQLEEARVDLIVSDINMPQMSGDALLKRVKALYPDIPVMLMTAYGTIEQAVDAMRDGAVDYMVKPFEAEVLINMVSRYVGEQRDDVAMIAVDSSSVELAAIAKRVAESDASIMITGESGSGKEVLAQYIHTNSSRADQPFVAINCAAIPENMLEATLFGYEKGAYTGAYKASPGKFEQAQGGTILLDEISEMDIGLQAKLLRVLQEKEVERLGGNKIIELDVRVLATSNRDMQEVVAEGKFREDLYYRLNVFPLHLLPLCERPRDIIPLTKRLLEKHALSAHRAIPVLTEDAEQKLFDYAWPGNVRELDNVVQRALILQSGEEITASDIHFEAARKAKPALKVVTESIVEQEVESDSNLDSLTGDLKQREWNLILGAIKSAKGSRKMTAEKLGISERTLRYKLARMRDAGITVPDSSGQSTSVG